MERDLDKNPYTPDEERVCEYLQKLTKNQIGCGDDPIGFLISSHAALAYSQQQDDDVWDALMKKVKDGA